MKDISLIICCHNSSRKIPATLKALSKQKDIKKYKIELIIVDNASTDNTIKIVQDTWSELNQPFEMKLINESIPGLSNARRKGVQNSNGKLILFCDDDNQLYPEYIKESVRIMNDKPSIGALGGAGIPISTIEFPAWFYTFSNYYAVGYQAERTGDVTSRGFVWGAGLTVRGNVLRRLYKNGVESALLGRTGEQEFAGDDAELCSWIRAAGYNIWFDSKLKFYHYILPHRLSASYYERLKEGLESSRGTLLAYRMLLRKNTVLLKIGLLIAYYIVCPFLILIGEDKKAYKIREMKNCMFNNKYSKIKRNIKIAKNLKNGEE